MSQRILWIFGHRSRRCTFAELSLSLPLQWGWPSCQRGMRSALVWNLSISILIFWITIRMFTILNHDFELRLNIILIQVLNPFESNVHIDVHSSFVFGLILHRSLHWWYFWTDKLSLGQLIDWNWLVEMVEIQRWLKCWYTCSNAFNISTSLNFPFFCHRASHFSKAKLKRDGLRASLARRFALCFRCETPAFETPGGVWTHSFIIFHNCSTFF